MYNDSFVRMWRFYLNVCSVSFKYGETCLWQVQSHHENLWLMKNDTEWINAHLPPIFKLSKQKDMLDWEKIDKNMAVKVKKVCLEIQESVPLERICITEIIRRVGNKSWVEKRELKLPETTRIINEKLESLEDFMLRKLKFVEALFIQEKKLPTRLQLKARAILRNGTSDNSVKIQNEIGKTLKRISEDLLQINNKL